MLKSKNSIAHEPSMLSSQTGSFFRHLTTMDDLRSALGMFLRLLVVFAAVVSTGADRAAPREMA